MLRLALTAELTGTSLQGLDIGLQRMVRRVADAAAGNKGLRQTFRELGLDANQLVRLAPDEQFKRIADAISAIPSQGERVRQTFKIFDTEGVKLKNLLDIGAAGVNQLQQEFLHLGAAISRVDAAKIEIANDSLARMHTAFRGLGNALTIELAPILAGLADEMTGLSTRTGGFREIVIQVVEIGSKGIGFLANAVQGLRLAFRGVQFVIAKVGQGLVALGEAYQRVNADLLNRIADGIAAFRQFRTSVQQSFSQMANAVVQSIVSVINRMLELVAAGAEKAVNSVIGAYNDVAEFLGFEGASQVSVGSVAVSAPEIVAPRNLEGGVLAEVEATTRGIARLQQASADDLAQLKAGFGEVADEYANTLDQLAGQELASDVISDWVSRVKARTQEAAEGVAQTAAKQNQAITSVSQNAGEAMGKASQKAARGAAQVGAAVSQSQSEINRLLERAKELLTTDAQRLAQEVAGWKRLLEIGKITQKQFDTLVQKSRERFTDLQTSFEGITDRMSSALDDFIDQGKVNFKGLATSIINDFAKVQIKLAAQNLFRSFSGSGGGGGLGSLFSSIGSFFGGARADGGPVTSGKTFLVGERGPELFTPSQSGTIIPNEALGSTQASRTIVLQESITVSPGVSREELRITLEEVERQRDEKQRRLIETGEAIFAGFVEA